MEVFTRPICDHKKTSEGRKVQATSTIILLWLLKYCEQKEKGKIKKKQKGEIFYAYVIFNETIKD